MARKLRYDTALFAAILLLLIVSVAWVYSASVVTAERRLNDPGHFLLKQVMWITFGVVGLLGMMRLDYHLLRRKPFLVACAGLAAAGLVLVFFCPRVNNAHRWLGLGGMGMQPSEFARLVTILCVASVLDRRLESGEPFDAGSLQVGGMVVLFIALILVEPDFGSALALTAVAGIMLYVAGLAYKWVIGALVLAPLPLFAVLMSQAYRRNRLLAFLHPWDDPLGDGFQVAQSLIAVGTGGVWGRGFMQGVQKMFYLPEAHSDFIYAVIAEEKGLVGATFVLLCFCLIAWRGLSVARRAPDAFGSLVALGITTTIVLQAMLNVSVVVGLMPAKGTPLPFVSAGGSSMLVSLAAMGILLNVSQQASATG